MTPPEELVGAASSGATAGPTPLTQHVLQLELPFEVKQRFRTKALTLATLETWVVLGMALLAERFVSTEKVTAFIVMFTSLTLAMGSLSFFWWLRHRFPANYLLLLVTTLLAGTFWAFTENSVFVDNVNMPVQVCIIMAAMMMTWLLTAQIRTKLYDTEILFGGLLLGWLIGALVDLAYVHFTGLAKVSAAPPVVGVLLSTVVILAAVARPMLRCCADDYMIVAVAFTANLFLLVSVPAIMMLLAVGGSGWPCESTEPNHEHERQQEAPPPTPQMPEMAQGDPAQVQPMI